MSIKPVLINGAWQPSDEPLGTFSSENPASKQQLPEVYPVSGASDVEACVVASQAAVRELRLQSAEEVVERLANFLDHFAQRIEAQSEVLVEIARSETGLAAEPRLKSVELPRTTSQLRQASQAVRERSWVDATIDTKTNIRSMYGPLGGAVVIFGPNNFPYAFNAIGGGDFASAIAAGNPVIAKAHPSHPGTSAAIAEAARQASEEAGLPKGMVQMLYALESALGAELIRSPGVAAVGFTGSRASGLALKRVADAAGKPIYLELSSINPVFVLPHAIEERAEPIADELAASCCLGVGQFCTNPGLTVLCEGDGAEAFVARIKRRFDEAPSGTLLNSGVEASLKKSVAQLGGAGAELLSGGVWHETCAYTYPATLLRVSGDTFLEQPRALQQEAFGPVNLVVMVRDVEQMLAVAEALEGNLTGAIYSHNGNLDDALYGVLASVLRAKVGRLLDDKMPTGVAVSPAMVHGGPYPSTGHPGFTSVGMPTAIKRFAALHGYDNVRSHRLPPELRDENPTGAMWRRIDGTFTQGNVGS